MDKKTKYLFYGGIGGIIFYLLIQFLPYYFLCKQGGDITCLVLTLLPQLIGFIILSPFHLENYIDPLLFSVIIYILLGISISWLIYHFRYERKK